LHVPKQRWREIAIVLSVFLRITASDYPFGIFKLFSHSLLFELIFYDFHFHNSVRIMVIQFELEAEFDTK